MLGRLGGERNAAEKRIRKSGIRNHDIPLLLAVGPERLLVEPSVEELRPHTNARAQGRLASGQRPVDGRPGREVRPIRQTCLHVVAQRRVDHDAAVHAVAILEIPAEPVERVAAVGIDGSLRIRRRQTVAVHREAGEGERAIGIPHFVHSEAVVSDFRAELHLMRALHGELELVLDLKLARPPSAADLRAAHGEGVEHANRLFVAGRYAFRGLPLGTETRKSLTH